MRRLERVKIMKRKRGLCSDTDSNPDPLYERIKKPKIETEQTVEFPPIEQKLDRKELRKLKNRESAARSRMAKEEKIDTLTFQVCEKYVEFTDLLQKNLQLKMQQALQESSSSSSSSSPYYQDRSDWSHSATSGSYNFPEDQSGSEDSSDEVSVTSGSLSSLTAVSDDSVVEKPVLYPYNLSHNVSFNRPNEFGLEYTEMMDELCFFPDGFGDF